jgi:O-antigen ligase
MAGAPVPPATSRAERVAVATTTLFLFVAPLAASGGTRAACLIIAALAIASSGTWREALASRPPRDVLLAVAAWFVLAPLSLAWTLDAGYTMAELRGEAFYDLLAFVACATLASDPRRWRAWCIALLAGTLLALVAKGLQQALGLSWWRHSPDGGPGAFSTHLVLVAPLLVALVWPSPWGFGRNAGVLAMALVGLFIAAWTTREAWTTPNRIVWPALAIVFVVTLLAIRSARRLAPVKVPGMRGVAIASALAILVAFGASIAAKNERYYRDDPSIIASLDQDLRPHLWAVGLEQWRQAPIMGHGYGREILAARFIPETPRGVDHPQIRHAHNAFLNIALQLGAVGLLAFLAVLATLARHYVALLARPDVAVLGAIGLALLAGFVAKDLTDDFLHRHNAQVFWALNGMLLGFSARSRATR